MMSKSKKRDKTAKKDAPVRTTLGFEEALKKALNTPLPKKQKQDKKPRS